MRLHRETTSPSANHKDLTTITPPLYLNLFEEYDKSHTCKVNNSKKITLTGHPSFDSVKVQGPYKGEAFYKQYILD
jgi:hypothetical protein